MAVVARGNLAPMAIVHLLRFCVLLAASHGLLPCAWAQPLAPLAHEEIATDLADIGKIGQTHENLRRAQERVTLRERVDDLYTRYLAWKSEVERATRMQFSMDVSLLQQWGLPGGGSPSLQLYASPSIDWTVFESKRWGTGSVQVAYTLVPDYPTRQDAIQVAGNLGLVTPVNDYPSRALNFTQLTYTHAAPGNRWLFTAGQYPLFNFDDNAYLGNQQQNFNNYIFAQNGSATYLTAGWGGYVQFNATRDVQLATGLQATNNVAGQTLSTRGAADHCCAWFAYAQWTPSFRGMGSAQYSVSWFDTPSIPAQPASRNWSLNAVQNLSDTWALFARANGARGYTSAIEASYALGAAMNDPLARASTDQIALALGYSAVSASAVAPARTRDEKIVEAYWTWTVQRGMLVTPSVQVAFDPARDTGRDRVTVLSLRMTLLF